MDQLPSLHRIEGCDIGGNAHYLRGAVGPGLADEVQQCYRAIVNDCLRRHCNRVLIVGKSKGDAFYHLALRDALRSMAVHGLPPDFRVAFVAETADLIAVYDTAVVEAGKHGIDARRFLTELDAGRWLETTP
jgi:hypothetical protein